ncbi:MAG TPA: NIPSNAP family protein [Micromonosporaceae bacterium]|nr:NIPSNAP family protein [Micromonosporaceae bacterium]
MTVVRCRIIELRQYTLHPGQRDVLINLFDREFVESQEQLGMTILGQFRDLDDPDRFVWLRGFDTMPGRAEALNRFYTGPVWRANSAAANATMIDSDDVLLLRPASDRDAFPAPTAHRPPPGHPQSEPSLVLATIYYRDRPFDDEFLDFFDTQVRPALAAAGAEPLACLQTEYAENTFPGLPIRTGEHALVWFARFASPAHADAFEDRLQHSEVWQGHTLPGLSTMITETPQRLRLAPTARSLLR